MKRSLELSRMNVRVGILALVGFAILVWVLFFPVRGVSAFSSRVSAYGFYDRVDGLRRNAPVYFRGIEVGNVKEVVIDPSRTEQPLKVTVAVEKRIVYLLPKETVMVISARGLLGDVFVDLVAPQAPQAGMPHLQDGDLLATKPYASVLEGMNDIAGQVKELLANLNSMVAKANQPNSSIGRLLHEDVLYKELVAAIRELKNTAANLAEIERTVNTKLLDANTKKAVDQAVASAQRMIDSADKVTSRAAQVRWHLSLGFSKYAGSLYGAGAGIRVIPHKDRFYEGGLSYFNQNLTFTAQDTFASGFAGYDVMLGWRVLNTPVFFRGGLKRTSVAVGLDWRLYEMTPWLPVELHADAYRFGNVVSQFDLGASFAFLKAFRLTVGAEDIANTPRYRAGLSLIYDDEDLTSIIVKAKTGL